MTKRTNCFEGGVFHPRGEWGSLLAACPGALSGMLPGAVSF